MHAAKPYTIVLKLGTSSILNLDTLTPRLSLLSSIVETCHALRLAGHKVVIVCSGAIGIGRMRMNVTQKPETVGERQALAALGQLRLMALWDNLFNQVGIAIAQVLLTRNDLADRPRYLNARTTLQTLLDNYKSIPIVNENDTVSVSELRFGDNDTLSAVTAGLIDADYLFLCTDVDGLYTGNPRSNPNARRLGIVQNVQEARAAVSVDTPGTSFGTGGMQTKLIAAELATAAGVATVVISSERPMDIFDVVKRGLPSRRGEPDSSVSSSSTSSWSAFSAQGTSTPTIPSMTSSIASLDLEEANQVGYPPLTNPAHTLFLPQSTPLPSRKWSILHALHPTGRIIIDKGAYSRLKKPESGGRLLPAGVLEISGYWQRMQAVRLVVRQAVPDPSTAQTVGKTVASVALGKDKADALTSRVQNTIDAAVGETQASTPAEEADKEKDISAAASTSQQSNTHMQDFEVGRCLANYTSSEIDRIRGLRSTEIERVLGFVDSEYVTDTVVLLDRLDHQ